MLLTGFMRMLIVLDKEISVKGHRLSSNYQITTKSQGVLYFFFFNQCHTDLCSLAPILLIYIVLYMINLVLIIPKFLMHFSGILTGYIQIMLTEILVKFKQSEAF